MPQALEGVAAVGLLYAAVRRWFAPRPRFLPGGARTHAGRRADVPLQQPGRAADAAAGRRRLRHGARRRERTHALARGSRRADRRRFQHQDAAGVPRGAGVRRWSTRSPATPPYDAGSARSCSPAWRSLPPPAGGCSSVELIPAADRPYIGGSQDNSLLNLIFGYNGFGRLTGNETGSVGGGGAAVAAGAPPAGRASSNRRWAVRSPGSFPAALILALACLWISRRAPRTDRLRAAVILWGGWFLVTALVFSYGAGIIHPYYTVALAPAIGALVGIGAATLWERRSAALWRLVLAAALAATSVWSYVLLERSSQWLPALRLVVLVAGLSGGRGSGLAPTSRAGRSHSSPARQESWWLSPGRPPMRSAPPRPRIQGRYPQPGRPRAALASAAAEALGGRGFGAFNGQTRGQTTGAGGQPAGQPGQAPRGYSRTGMPASKATRARSTASSRCPEAAALATAARPAAC